VNIERREKKEGEDNDNTLTIQDLRKEINPENNTYTRT